MQHTWLWRLRGDEKEGGSSQIQPSVSHTLGIIQQYRGIAKDRLAEETIIVIPTQLFGTATKILLTRRTRKGLLLPATASPISSAINFTQIIKTLLPGWQLLAIDHQAAVVVAGLLYKMRKHSGQTLAANSIGISAIVVSTTNSFKQTDAAQQVGIAIPRVAVRKQCVPIAIGKNSLHPLNVLGVSGAARNNTLDHSNIARLNRRFNLFEIFARG